MKSTTTIMKGDESGELVNINAYDAYGVANETNIGRFQYTGQIAIPELGLYHYKARVYSPTLGRFLQTDPIGYEDQVNLYAYAGNDPVNLVDPSGEKCVDVGENQYSCSLDDTGNLTKEEIARANKNLTITVNSLLSDPDRVVSLEADAPSYGVLAGETLLEETTAGDIAQGIIESKHVYGGASPVNPDTGKRSNAQFGFNDDGEAQITLFKEGLSQNDKSVQRTITHEGGHSTDAGQRLQRRFNTNRAFRKFFGGGQINFNKAHQRSFKNAAKKLIP